MFTRRQTFGMSLITVVGALAEPTFAVAADTQIDANKKVAEQYVSEVWDQGKLEALDEPLLKTSRLTTPKRHQVALRFERGSDPPVKPSIPCSRMSYTRSRM